MTTETSQAKGAPWLAVLALGAGSQIAQVVMLRELLMVFHGSELAVGLILASWLVWVGAGGALGGRLADAVRDPWRALAACACAIVLVLPATTLAARLLRGAFNVIPGAHVSFFDMTLSAFTIMAPAGLLLGTIFVLLSRIWREQAEATDTSKAASTYIVEGAGAIIGGVAFTFLLVRHASSFHCALLVGALLLVGVLLAERSRTDRLRTGRLSASAPQKVMPRNPDRGSRRLRKSGDGSGLLRWLLLSLLVASIVLGFFMDRLDSWAHRAHWRMQAPDHELVETRQSPHGTISVLRHGDQHAFYQSGHVAFSTSVPGAEGFELEEMDAAMLANLALTQHQSPRRLLLVGGGLRGVLREAARHPLELIHYVEFDPVMIEIARRHVPEATVEALDDPRVTVNTGDGRLHVKTTEERYDVILVDVPDPATAVLNRYYTREFFEEAGRCLEEGGVLVIGASTAGDMRGRAIANRNAAVFHTLRESFEKVVPALAGGQALFFAGDSSAKVTSDARELHSRHEQREVAPSVFSPAYFHSMLQESEQRRLAWLLMHHGRSPGAHLESPDSGPLIPPSLRELEREAGDLPPVQPRFFHNHDARPIGYYHTISAWDRLTRGSRPPAFDWMAGVRHWWILVLSLFSLAPILSARLLALAGSASARPKASLHAARLAVATTGLSTMAMQIALLFSFQSIYGSVYEMVGLIVSIFMAGLVTGAVVIKRWLGNRASWRALMAIQGAIAAFALLMALLVPQVATITSSPLIFSSFALLTFGAGLFSGLGFPVAVACYQSLVKSAEKATGSVYGIELLGSCAGAILAGVVIAPVLGLVACYLLSAAMNTTALVALSISGRQHAR